MSQTTTILPFHGLRYATDQVPSLEAVTAPPYDVIDGPMQQQLYARDPHNVVRLILNAVEAQDSPTANAYTRAANYFHSWQDEGVLQPETQPAIYAYTQRWIDEHKSEPVERKGIWALLKLEPYETGRVLPHEFTLKGPKLDRMNLMKSTLGNFSPIFMIYADPARQIEHAVFTPAVTQTLSWREATDADGTEHRIAPVSDPALIQQVQRCIRDQKLLIADGHHRYETALAFRAEVRQRLQEQTGAEPPDGSLLSDYLMVFMANLHDPGLLVYPTDRVLFHWPKDWDQTRFEEALHQRFDQVESGEDFIYQASGSPPKKLKLKGAAALGDLHPDLHKLDTAILEQAVFKGIFGQAGEVLKASHTLGFYRNPRQVQALLENREAVAVFYMATPPLSLIRDVCEAGHRMPQKSTYFYPKLLSGLVFYSYGRFPAGSPVEHALSDVVPANPIEPVLFKQDTLDHALALRPD